MDSEMPKKVDTPLLGVWLVLQASQAPMDGWGSEGRARERPEPLQAFLGEPNQVIRERRGQRAFPPGGGKGDQVGGGRCAVRGRDTSAEATEAAKANPLLLGPTDTREEPQIFGDPRS